ncbi:DNA translocase FtsK [Campylobacter sp. MIT 21-1685]|uniref:DNA translocase FtsK n=1 Tax=unclassified Campylobacter TaxID=2593542 RepID=UPI00224B3300|nr:MULTISPECIES: DNA translocase FtsK [unclassified Campylobacter]MCX2682947.1 DNA translocase FtsK [Campylobacter sp. MIT 21-1684]MCX2751229.1 DNA translocase FtsK [Campylobacter sp. MIT 21-1682]MCX2807428.1 DNA translocase FtsK [Campylobacter sp. MIT 21-1685]
MLAPSMGLWIYKINISLFGEFAYYYPFMLFFLNYISYKKSYKLENFTRRELCGIVCAFFSCLLLFAVFYKDFGYILEFFYTLFSNILGHLGTGIVALVLLFFSFILLFPKIVKELFHFELRFTLLLQVEQSFKTLLMSVFGGESQNVQFKQEDSQMNFQEQIKRANINASNTSFITAKEKFEKLKKQILDDKIEIDIQNIQNNKSFIYETSTQVQNFAQKASRTTITLDEEFNFILKEEVDMIPKRFLKPKKTEELQEFEVEKNLDEPSYKRKNIDVFIPKTESKPKIFSKELELREDLIQKAKLEQEYKQYQNQILKNKVQEEIKELERQAIQETKIPQTFIEGNKYTLMQENNSHQSQEMVGKNLNSDEKEDADQNSEKSSDKTSQDFIPIVEELDLPLMPQTPIINMDELEQKNEQIQRVKNVIAKEIDINKALLKEIEQGDRAELEGFTLPSLEFLTSATRNKQEIDENEIDKKIYNLLEKLRRFKIGGDVVSTYIGPVVTTFEFRPSADVKVSRILNLQDDLTMALMAKSIRIQAPIPGKDVVGIEVPNDEIQTIYLREILESELFQNSKSPLTIALGKDIVGNAFITDLKKLPHLLIAGTTGSGKSVGINSMLLSLLYRNSPKTLRLMMIDPKMLEFSIYNDIPHLLTPVITEAKKAVNALSNMVAEMERRYRLMAEAKTKNIENYNEKMKELSKEQLPFIVVIIDELADLMMNAGKDVEFYIARLAQMARASGIHLIVATQRPSVDVVTGLIKANLPSRISYKVGQKIDSKVILDTMGAESLLGRGDCLFTPPGTSSIVRLHAPFASEFEIENIVDFLKKQAIVEYDESFLNDVQNSESEHTLNKEELDELYEEAKRVIFEDRKTSISYIQRRLKIGYNRAANIIEQLAQNGILSEADSKGQREIL